MYEAEQVSAFLPAVRWKEARAPGGNSPELRLLRRQKLRGSETDLRTQRYSRRDCVLSSEFPEEVPRQPTLAQICYPRCRFREQGSRRRCIVAWGRLAHTGLVVGGTLCT